MYFCELNISVELENMLQSTILLKVWRMTIIWFISAIRVFHVDPAFFSTSTWRSGLTTEEVHFRTKTLCTWVKTFQLLRNSFCFWHSAIYPEFSTFQKNWTPKKCQYGYKSYISHLNLNPCNFMKNTILYKICVLYKYIKYNNRI